MCFFLFLCDIQKSIKLIIPNEILDSHLLDLFPDLAQYLKMFWCILPRFYLQKSVLIISIVNMIDWKPIYQPLMVW